MADKSKTIKDASDKELDDLLRRLEKERQVQSLIRDLIRNSKPASMNPYEVTSYPTVSTESPIESMYHVGIPGMHWGVRRARSTSSGGKLHRTKSEDAKVSSDLKKKPVKELSTAELKTLTTRMQLEKQYRDLKPSDLKKGMLVVKGITAAGTTVTTLYALSKSPLAQDIAKAVAKKRG